MKIKNLVQIGSILLFVALNARFSACLSQETMTPQGESRIPVDAAHAPGTDAASFLITNSGSYYLASNVDGTNKRVGIEIATNNVTLDLNGFCLMGSSSGIYIPCGTNCSVINGSISGCSGAGIYSQANDANFERLSIVATGYGVQCLGDAGVIKDCSFYHNANTSIILYGGNYVVAGNNCADNNTLNAANGTAIFVNSSNNRIENNYISGGGPAGYGIWVNMLASTTNNVVIQNSVAGYGTNNFKVDENLNDVGPIGMATVSISPWANISHP
jgi:hypothetical protein